MSQDAPKKVKKLSKKESADKFKAAKELIKSVGRRKTSVARISLCQGTGAIAINGRPYAEYVAGREYLISLILKPLNIVQMATSFDIDIKADGGGIAGQADAIRLGIARALILVNPQLKGILSKEGCLARDSRAKERKKYGRKKARKRFQFSKR